MRKLKDILADIKLKADAAQVLYAKGDQATAEDLESVRTLNADIQTLETEAEEAKTFEAGAAANAARIASLGQVQTFEIAAGVVTNDAGATTREFAVPNRTRTRNFHGEGAQERAYRFGQWFAGGIVGNQRSVQWCREHGIEFAMSSDVDSAGGITVPEEFRPDILMLLETYGVARQLAANWNLTRDKQMVPRGVGELTVYCPGQNNEITASDVSFDGVSVNVDTFATLTLLANELVSDSAIGMADYVIGAIARAFAANEDNMFINGNGTSTYFGRVGLEAKMLSLDATPTIANIAGLRVATTNTKTDWGYPTVADMAAVVAKLPDRADNGNTRWLCSKPFFGNVMERLAWAAGGNAKRDIETGVQKQFMGYPVVTSSKCTRVPVASGTQGAVLAYLGDFSQGVAFGDRNEYTIARSTEYKFANNQLAIRGTERVDIVVHDVGNASATAASRIPGSIVALIADA